MRRKKGRERERGGVRWHFCRETFPSEGVSLPPIKEKAFSVVPYASEKSQRIPFRFLLPPNNSFSLFHFFFALIPLQRFYSVESLALNENKEEGLRR